MFPGFYEETRTSYEFLGPTATKNIQFVDMQLVVMDAGKYSNYDILPLPADIAAKVVTDCFTILKGQLPPDKRVDSVAEENFKR